MGQDLSRNRAEVYLAVLAYDRHVHTLPKFSTAHSDTKHIGQYFEALKSVKHDVEPFCTTLVQAAIAASPKLLTSTGWGIHDEFCKLQDTWANAPGLGVMEASRALADITRLALRVDAAVLPNVVEIAMGNEKRLLNGFLVLTWPSGEHAVEYAKMIRRILNARIRFLYVPFTRLYRVGSVIVTATTLPPLTQPLCADNHGAMMHAVTATLGNGAITFSRTFLGIDGRYYLCDNVMSTLHIHGEGLSPPSQVFAAAAGFLEGLGTNNKTWYVTLRHRFPIRVRTFFQLATHCVKSKLAKDLVMGEILARAIKRAVRAEWQMYNATGDRALALTYRFIRSLLAEDDAAYTFFVSPMLQKHFQVPKEVAAALDVGSVFCVGRVYNRVVTMLGLFVTGQFGAATCNATSPTYPPSALVLKKFFEETKTAHHRKQLALAEISAQKTVSSAITGFMENIEVCTIDTPPHLLSLLDMTAAIIAFPKFLGSEKIKEAHNVLRATVQKISKTGLLHDIALGLRAMCLLVDDESSLPSDAKLLETMLVQLQKFFIPPYAYRLWVSMMSASTRHSEGQGDYDEKQLQLCRMSVGDNSYETAVAGMRVAGQLLANGQMENSKSLLHASLETLRKVREPSNVMTVTCLNNLACTYFSHARTLHAQSPKKDKPRTVSLHFRDTDSVKAVFDKASALFMEVIGIPMTESIEWIQYDACMNFANMSAMLHRWRVVHTYLCKALQIITALHIAEKDKLEPTATLNKQIKIALDKKKMQSILFVQTQCRGIIARHRAKKFARSHRIVLGERSGRESIAALWTLELTRSVRELTRWLLDGRGKYIHNQFVLGGCITQYPLRFLRVGALHDAIMESGDGTLDKYPHVEILLRSVHETTYNYFEATATGKILPIQAIKDFTQAIFFEFRLNGALEAMMPVSADVVLVQRMLRARGSQVTTNALITPIEEALLKEAIKKDAIKASKEARRLSQIEDRRNSIREKK